MLRSVAIGLIRIYQVVLSPLKPAVCRFHPSCSTYACDAIGEHGVVRGIYLSARRLLRCHPLSPGGYDPVPPATVAKRKINRRIPEWIQKLFWR